MIMRYLLKKTWLYIVVFIIMLVLFAFYPLCFQEQMYEHIRQYVQLIPNNIHNLNKANLLYELTVFTPLFYISVIGLFISLINTLLFCIVDINDKEKKFNRILAIFAIIFTTFIFWSIEEFFDNMDKDILTYQCNQFKYEELVESMIENYNIFSLTVTKITFLTIILFLIIDIKDIILQYRIISRSKEESEINETKLDQRYSFFQLFLIDIPVLLVSIIITIYNQFLDGSILPINLSRGHTFQNIFCGGAWGIQIIYSQIVFFVLMIFYYIEKKNLILRYNTTN